MAELTPQETRDEIDLDPEGLGYAPLVNEGANNAIVDLFNGATTADIDLDEVPSGKFQAAVVTAEYETISASLQRLWLGIVGRAQVEIRDPGIRSQLVDIWGPATTTRANLIPLQTRKATRAEEISGADSASRTAQTMTRQKVREALAL